VKGNFFAYIAKVAYSNIGPVEEPTSSKPAVRPTQKGLKLVTPSAAATLK